MFIPLHTFTLQGFVLVHHVFFVCLASPSSTHCIDGSLATSRVVFSLSLHTLISLSYFPLPCTASPFPHFLAFNLPYPLPTSLTLLPQRSSFPSLRLSPLLFPSLLLFLSLHISFIQYSPAPWYHKVATDLLPDATFDTGSRPAFLLHHNWPLSTSHNMLIRY